VSPDKKLLAVVGDDRDALLVDSQNGKVFWLLYACSQLVLSWYLSCYLPIIGKTILSYYYIYTALKGYLVVYFLTFPFQLQRMIDTHVFLVTVHGPYTF
jgi:hypothetical protein